MSTEQHDEVAQGVPGVHEDAQAKDNPTAGNPELNPLQQAVIQVFQARSPMTTRRMIIIVDEDLVDPDEDSTAMGCMIFGAGFSAVEKLGALEIVKNSIMREASHGTQGPNDRGQ